MKRGNDEGSIRRRADGRWEARITTEDGKRKSFYGKTRQEVARLLAQGFRDRNSGLPLVNERQSVEQYLSAWMMVTKPTIRPRTWKRYGEYTRLHLIPTIGKIPLAKLSAQHVQTLYAQKLQEGLSSTTVRHMHAVLHRALDAALRLGLVQRNVSDMVDPPRMAHHEMAVLSLDQVRGLLATVAGDRLEALYVVAVTTGMRQGELLALKWRDVDLPGACLQVRATLQLTPDGYMFAEPKTAHSRRRVALPATAIEVLQRHRENQLEERFRLGPAWEDLDLVFPNSIGRPMDGVDLLRREFLPALQQAGLPRIRFHDLRHTAATLLLSSGINPKIVSEMLGHASVSITLDIYSHVLPHMQQAATAAMDALLGRFDSSNRVASGPPDGLGSTSGSASDDDV